MLLLTTSNRKVKTRGDYTTMATYQFTFTLRSHVFTGIPLSLASITQQEYADVEASNDLEATQRAMIRLHEISSEILSRGIGHYNGNITQIDRVTLVDNTFRLLSKDDIAVIGYFDWRDTVCSDCINNEPYKHDVSDHSPLYADDEHEYLCSYCGYVFNEQTEAIPA